MTPTSTHHSAPSASTDADHDTRADAGETRDTTTSLDGPLTVELYGNELALVELPTGTAFRFTTIDGRADCDLNTIWVKCEDTPKDHAYGYGRYSYTADAPLTSFSSWDTRAVLVVEG